MSDPNNNKITIESMTNAVLDRMDCPLLSIKRWDCTPKPLDGDEPQYPTLIKGKETFCKNGKFMNCPAYQRYFNFRFSRLALEKEKSSKKER